MRVTIIGPGKMGRGIATRLLAGGHAVTLVGRERQQAEALAAELEPRVSGEASVAAASGPEEAIPDSDVVVLALPYATSLSVAQRLGALLSGKVVVDISNPLNESYDALVTGGDASAAETIRAALPSDARVVKAFNTTFAGTLLEGEVAGQPLDVFIAGDDLEAVHAVVELARTGGLRPIEVGGLERARQLEALGFLSIAIQEPLGTGFMSGWKLVVPGTAQTPARHGFPRKAIVGVLDDPHVVGATVRALIETGIRESSIHTLYGAEGKRRIQSAWEGHHSLYDLMAVGFEQEHTERHLSELDAGHTVVVVEVSDDATAHRASEILAAHGGHFIFHYTRWTARNVAP